MTVAKKVEKKIGETEVLSRRVASLELENEALFTRLTRLEMRWVELNSKKQVKKIDWEMVRLGFLDWFDIHGRGLFIGVVLAVAGFAVGYVW